ncbi:biotin--protein ligase isoform X2 [Stegostoma tigrinum]|uniref:biotin--protein ligase isoform X2 n=1 Tax=Stegostoma tigrinum TaxID=3053191 RepID=UPI00287012FF|nr:biotin--protein ligase isoform X2 [Stegostoma tigrinum]
MLITLCYVYLWIRLQKCYAMIIFRSVRRFHRMFSLTFTALPPDSEARPYSPSAAVQENICVRLADRAFLLAEPQKLCDDLSKWSLHPEPVIASTEHKQQAQQITFLIEAIFGNASFDTISVSSEKILKYSDLCVPLAYLLGNPYKLIAEANVDNFSRLGVAFMENRLQMDNGMVPQKIVSLQLNESVQMKLLEPSVGFQKEWQELGHLQDLDIAMEPCHKSTLIKPVTDQNVGSCGDTCSTVGSTEKLRQPEMDELKAIQNKEFHITQEAKELEEHEGYCLHLASCSECLELENSTIESVKYASAENLLDLPDDYCGSSDETVVGEDNFTINTGQSNKNGKPPNVLIYVGSDYSQYLVKFKQIKSVLLDCLDNESYVIYPLLEEQVLKVPWVDNAVLLVVACDDPVPEQIHAKFMTYLSKGGKILGLCTSFSFGEIKVAVKKELKGKIHRWFFTKSDSKDITLHAFISGKAFLRETKNAEEAMEDLELWGSLANPEKDIVIVRLPYGENGGEAVLCQVHLEIPPDSKETQMQQDFRALKLSNALRYEVLTEILTYLQLNCELSQVPPLTPVYLLTTAEDIRQTFLKWLWPRLDKEGVLKSQKVSLKVVTMQQPGMEVTRNTLPVIIESPKVSSEYFDLKVYCENLQTNVLGQIVFFSEVIITTMDLFDGLMLSFPEEVGLIAIAIRQTQGKGRGGNIWLSPIGCAMFTLHTRIQAHSKLGQNISFVQHLMALAAVESVVSMPGYEDIDLRLKWPNDIYYSNLMKLGGVLVNSTLMGATFHVLVGCGFNVSNSNPTICINDIIQQHNKENGTDLQTLRIDLLIARTVTIFENLMSIFQEKGPNGVLPLYYKRWLHSGTKVRLWKEDGPIAWVVGLDDSGFLQVQLENDEDIVTVQPDGNSFDMLRNLMITKHH